MKTKVIGYARVSSREQFINSHALEQQIERLKLAGAEEVFTDVESGYKGKQRPQLEKVLEMVRSHQVSEVIVTRLDRLSRRGKQSFAIFDDFLEANVVLKALDEPVDLSTPSGRMTAGLLAVLAQHHSDQKSEAVKHGWQHLRNRQVAMNPPFGYCKVNDKYQLDSTPFLCLLSNQETRSKSAIASEIVEAFFQAGTLRGCLRIINERYGIQTFAHHHKSGGLFARGIFRFSVGGLSNWLVNPVLQGHTCYLRNKKKSDVKYNTHTDQCLITPLQILEIERILSKNRQVRGYGHTGQKYPLSGLMFCGECRSACYSLKCGRGKNQPGYNYYFQCKNWRVRSCKQKSVVQMGKAENAVILELTKLAEKIADLSQAPDVEIETPEIKSLKNQLAGLSELGSNPAIEKAKQEIRNQIQGLKIRHNSHNSQSAINKDLLLWTFSDPSCWHKMSSEEKARIFRNLVEKVIVRNGEVEEIILKI